MNLAIEKSGTGIEKSGTGIEKSGTGIEKSGTGLDAGHPSTRSRLWLAPLLLTIFMSAAHAQEPSLLLSQHDGGVQISIHTEHGIFAGSATTQSGQTFVQIDLRDALSNASSSNKSSTNCGQSGLMTHGAGTGSVRPCASALSRWGQAEIVLVPEGTFILVHQDDPAGSIEILADFQAAPGATPQLSSNDSIHSPNRWLTRN